MKLPDWLQNQPGGDFKSVSGLDKREFRLRFLDRTLKAMAGLLDGYLLSEAFVFRPGILQGLDPRAKFIGILVLIVCTSLVHSFQALGALYSLALFLAVLSKIPMSLFIRRVWAVIPFFAGLIALPATLNLFTQGEPILKLYTLGRAYSIGPYVIPQEISFTRQGVHTALFLVSRVGISLSFILLLTLTTPWSSLLKALRSLRVPQIYVQILGMTLRYLLLLSQTVREMLLAKKSRTLRAGTARAEQRWIAGEVGALFRRSMHLSVEVHGAMVARGFRGEVQLLIPPRVKVRDCIWTAFCAGISGLLIYYGG